MKNQRWISIDRENTATDEFPKLEKYMPVLQEIARRWRIHMVIDYKRSGKFQDILLASEEKEKTKETIFVHLAYSEIWNYDRLNKIGQIFTYPLKPDLYFTEVSSNLQFDHVNFLSSDDGTKIIYIQGRHLFIGPDIFDERLPEPEDVMRILLHIGIARILDRILVNVNIAKTYPNRTKRLQAVLRRRLASTKETKIAYLEKVFTEEVKKRRGIYEDNLKTTNEKTVAELTKLTAAQKEIAFLQAFLEYSIVRLKPDFGEIFEEILCLEGIAKVETRKVTNSDNVDRQMLIVYTEQLQQTIDENKYDIGSVRIELDPLNPDKSGIRVYQHIPGSFTHFHAIASTTDICFGSVLNEAMNKLMFEFEVVMTIHMLLTFLRLETHRPNAQEKNVSSPLPTTKEAEVAKYSSNKDRLTAKETFVTFMEYAYKTSQRRVSQQRLIELVKEEAETKEKYWKLVQKRREEERLIDFAGSIIQDLRSHAEQELNKLLKNKDVVWIEEKNGLRIYLWNPKRENMTMFWLTDLYPILVFSATDLPHVTGSTHRLKEEALGRQVVETLYKEQAQLQVANFVNILWETMLTEKVEPPSYVVDC